MSMLDGQTEEKQESMLDTDSTPNNLPGQCITCGEFGKPIGAEALGPGYECQECWDCWSEHRTTGRVEVISST